MVWTSLVCYGCIGLSKTQCGPQINITHKTRHKTHIANAQHLKIWILTSQQSKCGIFLMKVLIDHDVCLKMH